MSCRELARRGAKGLQDVGNVMEISKGHGGTQSQATTERHFHTQDSGHTDAVMEPENSELGKTGNLAGAKAARELGRNSPTSAHDLQFLPMLTVGCTQ